MAQLGGIIALQAPVSDGQGTFFFGGVDGVKWRKPVTPGDVLVMEVKSYKHLYIGRTLQACMQQAADLRISNRAVLIINA
jgi:3-hydroxymyristoyl/3-hydroxydecanoyl-(acyl carrier protein) dehydratase